MNHIVQPRLPYLQDPDYLQAFLAGVTSVSGYPVELTALSYNGVGVEITRDQAIELSHKKLVGSVRPEADFEMALERKFLVRSDDAEQRQ